MERKFFVYHYFHIILVSSRICGVRARVELSHGRRRDGPGGGRGGGGGHRGGRSRLVLVYYYLLVVVIVLMLILFLIRVFSERLPFARDSPLPSLLQPALSLLHQPTHLYKTSLLYELVT